MSAAPSLSLGLQSLLIAAGGVALWLLLRLVWRLAQLVPLADAQRRRLSRLGPPLAAIIVVTYTVFAARLQLARLQGTELWMLVGLLLVALAAGWLALSDVIAGVLIKAAGTCEAGKHVRLDTLEGKITSLGVRTLTLETANGEVAVLPYRQLLQQTLYVIPEAQGFSVHRFELHVPPDVSVSQLRRWLTEAALSMHQCSVARTPELIHSGSGRYEVTVFALHADYTSEVEFRVRAALTERMAERRTQLPAAQTP